MNDVTFAAAFAKELDMEARATEKCLERIDQKFFEFKPHEKSMVMGYLAHLVAEIPLWTAHMLTNGDIDFVNFEHAKLNNGQELANHFRENVAKAKDALQKVKEGDLAQPFSLKNNGQVLFTSTKKEVIEQNTNHMVHHRGQLTVYMRLNDIAVPSIYGPSADDRSF